MRRTLLVEGAPLRRAIFIFALTLMTLVASRGNAQQPFLRETRDFLTNHISLTGREIRRVQSGRMVAKVLDTPLDHEVAIFGIIWVDVPTKFYVDQFRDIEVFEKSRNVLAINKISDPPRVSDFASMKFPEEDLDAIPNCKVGDCDVKIDEEGLLELQREVSWSSPDAHARANERLRKMAKRYIDEYRRGGNQALAAYRDKKRPTYISKEFEGLLENSPYLPEYIPELHRYLLDYPHATLPRSEDFLYWSTVKFGLKTTVRLNHVVIYRDHVDVDDDEVAIASKMLYGSHYFHTALELRFLVREGAKPGTPGFYLMVLNRSRADGLTGFTGSLIRGTIRRRARASLGRFLEKAKVQLEEAYRR